MALNAPSGKIRNLSNELLNNAGTWSVDQLVVWLSSHVEFDTLLRCINEKLYANINDLNLVSEIVQESNIPSRKQHDLAKSIVAINYFVEPESKDDVMLYVISRLRDKRFTLLNIKEAENPLDIYTLEFLNYDGNSFNVPYSTFINILRNVNMLPDYDGNNEFTQETIETKGGKLPIYFGKLFGEGKLLINTHMDNSYNTDKVWMEIFDTIKELGNTKFELSCPRQLEVNNNRLEKFGHSGKALVNPFHIPGMWGNSETKFNDEQANLVRKLLECQKTKNMPYVVDKKKLQMKRDIKTKQIRKQEQEDFYKQDLKFGRMRKRSPRFCFGS